MNKTYKILTFIFLGATIILSIGLVFTGTGNRTLKRENKALQEQITAAEKRIEERTVVIDNLKIDLEKWNKTINININEADIDSLNFELDNNIVFLSKFLDGADSLAQ